MAQRSPSTRPATSASAGRFERWRLTAPAGPVVRVYQMPPAAIQWLTALMEAYDGIGLVRTLDEGRGIVECWMMPDYLSVGERLMADVAREWPVQVLGREFE